MIILESNNNDHQIAIDYIYDLNNKENIIADFRSVYKSNNKKKTMFLYFNHKTERLEYSYSNSIENSYSISLLTELNKRELIDNIKYYNLLKKFKSYLYSIKNSDEDLTELIYDYIMTKLNETISTYNQLLMSNDHNELIEDNIFSYKDAAEIFPNEEFMLYFKSITQEAVNDIDFNKICFNLYYNDTKLAIKRFNKLIKDNPNNSDLEKAKMKFINKNTHISTRNSNTYIEDNLELSAEFILDKNEKSYSLLNYFIERGFLNYLDKKYNVAMLANSKKWDTKFKDLLVYSNAIDLDNLIKVINFTDLYYLELLKKNLELLISLNKKVIFYEKDNMIRILNSFYKLSNDDIYLTLINTINKLNVTYDYKNVTIQGHYSFYSYVIEII